MAEPLYYCSVCKSPVKVTARKDQDALIEWDCGHDGHTVIAPRKVTLYGEGGIDMAGRVKLAARQLASWLTGRNI